MELLLVLEENGNALGVVREIFEVDVAGDVFDKIVDGGVVQVEVVLAGLITSKHSRSILRIDRTPAMRRNPVTRWIAAIRKLVHCVRLLN